MIKKLIVIFLSLSTILSAQITDSEPVQAKIIVEQSTVQPEQPFWVAITLNLENGWHAYWRNPGDAGMPPTIDWKLPEGFEVIKLLWPTPQKYTLNTATSYGYSKSVTLLAEIKPSSHPQNEVKIGADIQWVVCNDSSCLPGGAEVETSITFSPESPEIHPDVKEKFTHAWYEIPELHLKVHAEKENDLIRLQIGCTDDVIEAEFFPDEKDRIDPTAKAVVSKAENDPAITQVILKDSGQASSSPLKGVIVLKTATGQLAYEIDTPVHSTSTSEIAEVTPSEMTNKIHADSGVGMFLFYLTIAFIGGVILNFMPCVLPVISFKVLSFVKMAGQDRKLIFKHGLSFSAGVMISFWFLAGLFLTFRAYGHNLGWGFQLQNPFFIAILASIIFIFGLSMLGVFEFGTGIASLAGQAQVKNQSTGLTGSFFSGILATLLATPCAGPFIGTVVGVAVTKPTFQAMMIFTSLGFGMTSPYLLLGAFPDFLKYMPKPGKWMVTFKELVGLVMVGTTLWLVYVFLRNTKDVSSFYYLGIAFFCIALGCWIYGKWATPVRKKKVRITGTVLTLVLLLVGGMNLYSASTYQPTSEWQTFSPQRVAELRQKGVPVFVDFTADWCMICKVNHLVLTRQSVEKKFEELGVVKMIADLSQHDPMITAELEKYGRNSVPLYLLYQPNNQDPATILPQVLTPGTVIEYLEQL